MAAGGDTRPQPSRQGSTPPPFLFLSEDFVRTLTAPLCVFVIAFTAATALAALPIRKPDVEAQVEKIVPATDAEKTKGVVVTIFLKDRKEGVQIVKTTPVHKQMGKLVPVVDASEIKEGVRVSLWIDGKTGTAEGVLIFP